VAATAPPGVGAQERGFLGVELQDLTKEEAEKLVRM